MTERHDVPSLNSAYGSVLYLIPLLCVSLKFVHQINIFNCGLLVIIAVTTAKLVVNILRFSEWTKLKTDSPYILSDLYAVQYLQLFIPVDLYYLRISH